MVRVGVDLGKGDFVWIVLLIFVFIVGFVVAYNSGASPDVMGHSAEEIDLGVELVCRVERSDSTDSNGNEYAECNADEIAISGGCVQTTMTDPDMDAFALWPSSVGAPVNFASDGEIPVAWGCDSNTGTTTRYAFAVCCKKQLRTIDGGSPSEADCYTTDWGPITTCLNYPVADIPSCNSGYTFSGLAAVYQGDSGCGVSTLTKQKVKARCCK